MNPEIWGPCAWKVLHILAIGYPKDPTYEDRASYKNFYENFWKVIPCYACKQNYKRHLKEVNIEAYLDNNLKLFEWTVILHNIVNKELKKPEVKLEDAIRIYRNKLNKDKININNDIYFWIIIVFLIGVIVYIQRDKIREVFSMKK
jgi:hypothetical protein